jgi:hypothetical protein
MQFKKPALEFQVALVKVFQPSPMNWRVGSVFSRVNKKIKLNLAKLLEKKKQFSFLFILKKWPQVPPSPSFLPST